MRKNKKQKKESKASKIRNYLIKHGSITSWQSITMFRATRLAAEIHNLRKKGWYITTEMKMTDEGNAYAKYHFKPTYKRA